MALNADFYNKAHCLAENIKEQEEDAFDLKINIEISENIRKMKKMASIQFKMNLKKDRMNEESKT